MERLVRFQLLGQEYTFYTGAPESEVADILDLVKEIVGMFIFLQVLMGQAVTHYKGDLIFPLDMRPGITFCLALLWRCWRHY